MIKLIKLARFISPKDQRMIAQDIEEQFTSQSLNIYNDPWGHQRRLIIEGDNNKKSNFNNELFNVPGIIKIICFEKEFFNKESNSLGELINLILPFLKSNCQTKNINIEFKGMGKVPFHRRAIEDRLKKKSYFNAKNNVKNAFSLYIESKIIDNKIISRIGEKSQLKRHKTQLPLKLLLLSPYTTQEISDFFRLALNFNIEVILTNENKKVHDLVKEVSESYFKGISKIKYQIYPNFKGLINKLERSEKSKKTKFVGFSLWSPNNEHDYYTYLNSNREKNGEKIFEWILIFGNEDKGLNYLMQKQMQTFSLGWGGSSEPMRSSHAAAYAIAIFSLSRI